jgi:hypothetical protein
MGQVVLRCTPKCTEQYTEIPGFDDYGCHPCERSSLKRFFLSFVMQGLFSDISPSGAGGRDCFFSRSHNVERQYRTGVHTFHIISLHFTECDNILGECLEYQIRYAV